jgi:hypothetical protein
MKKIPLKKIVEKIKPILKPSKKTFVERRKAERRNGDRRWMSKVSPEKNLLPFGQERRVGERRTADRRLGDRRKS